MRRRQIYQFGSTALFTALMFVYTNCSSGFKADEVNTSIVNQSSGSPSNDGASSPNPAPSPNPMPAPAPMPLPNPFPNPTPGTVTTTTTTTMKAPTTTTTVMPTTTTTTVPAYPANPIPAGTQVQEVSCNFGATEGPSWSPTGNFAVFTDWGNKLVYKYTEETNKFTVYVNQGDAKDGTTYDRNGNLIAATFGNSGGQLIQIDTNGGQSVLATTYQGKRFNGLNDVAIFKDNSIYFTDTGQPNEISFNGVYRYRGPGQVDLIDSSLSPNGIGFSPDYKRLYITNGEVVMQFDVADNGSVSNKRVFYAPPTNTGGDSGQDGLAVDKAGNVYITYHNRIWVVNSAGKLITSINVPNGYLTNVAFGSKDLQTLYITSGGCLLRIRTLIPGIPFG